MSNVAPPCLIILCGLPGSGKTTLARRWVAAAPGRARVSRDDLRAMLHAGRYSEQNEQLVVAARDALIRAALAAGRSVVVDETALSARVRAAIIAVARELGAAVYVVRLRTPIAVCIARDAARMRPVGEGRIREMAAQRG